MIDKVKRFDELGRLKEALVQDVLAQSDEETLAQAAAGGANPDEARSRVLDALRMAKERFMASEKPTLRIDAARARNILRRVAQRPPVDAPVPLLQAAQLEAGKNDTEVIEVVTELRDLGVVSDDELKEDFS
jgi:hypothetical protein